MRAMLHLAAGVAVCASCVAGEIYPPTWDLGLEDAFESLSNDLDAATTQRAMDRLSTDMSSVKDAQLFLIYIKLYQTLDAKGQGKLKAEQEKWIEQREERAAAAATTEGGTMAGLELAMEFIKITDERIADLRGRLGDE